MNDELLKRCNDALKGVILALDESEPGPAVNILPWFQLEKILKVIEEIDDYLDRSGYNKENN